MSENYPMNEERLKLLQDVFSDRRFFGNHLTRAEREEVRGMILYPRFAYNASQRQYFIQIRNKWVIYQRKKFIDKKIKEKERNEKQKKDNV